ncbi:MAG: 1-phosphofructokinase [Eubacterium sp.]|jgi:1-phosphofructokinase|nr:1-phosphofructokinase [Eubacterium sp.]
MIITITLNPAVDKTVEIPDFEVGTVNRVASVRLDAGGKGINVSKVIMSLGGKSCASGVVGGATGNFIKDALNRMGIDNEFLTINGETRTNLKVVDSKRKTNTDINEPGPMLSSDDLKRLEEIIFEKVDKDTVMVFSGSVPANVEKDIYGKWIRTARNAGAKTILDADGQLLKLGIEAGPYMVKPNIIELERFFGEEISGIQVAERKARSLIDTYGIEFVAVSLGSKGAIFLNKDSSLFTPGIEVEVKSTVGAGDSMVAALTYSIDTGIAFEEAARLAVASATANVMTTGTQPADFEVIMELQKKVVFDYVYKS